jgi:DNA-binding PadR family transcriptional regulator
MSSDVRLSGTSYAVLGLIGYLEPCSPYDLKRYLEQSVENFWPVPHTTFYAEPARLAKGGFLAERREAGGRRRKLYTLTDPGRQALHEWARSPEVAPPQLRDEGELKVFAGADPVPIFTVRRDWHRAKLAELEGYLHGLGEEPNLQGVRASLLAGVAYHRLLLEAIERFLSDQAATGSS